jgi:hypothetical protein
MPATNSVATAACSLAAPGFHDLVKRVEGKPAAGEMAINGTHAERQRLPMAPTTLKPTNALAQLGQSEVAPGMQHALPQGFRVVDVPILFS